MQKLFIVTVYHPRNVTVYMFCMSVVILNLEYSKVLPTNENCGIKSYVIAREYINHVLSRALPDYTKHKIPLGIW